MFSPRIHETCERPPQATFRRKETDADGTQQCVLDHQLGMAIAGTASIAGLCMATNGSTPTGISLPILQFPLRLEELCQREMFDGPPPAISKFGSCSLWPRLTDLPELFTRMGPSPFLSRAVWTASGKKLLPARRPGATGGSV